MSIRLAAASPRDAVERRVLLTGATGFLGRHLHRALLAAGHSVRTVARRTSRHLLIDDRDAVFTDDIFSQSLDFWIETCSGVDVVLHAAWFVDPTRYLSAPENIDCLNGTLTLARGAAQTGVRHFVGIGTCFEYRHGPEPLDIYTPLDPGSLYAASKAACFLMLPHLTPGQTMGISWTRLFYLHGPGEAPTRFVPYLRAKLEAGEPADLSAGSQLRDFLDVRDVAAMLCTVLATGQLGAINICSGKPVSIRQLAERIADEYGRRDLLKFGVAPLKATDPPAVVGVCNLLPSKGATT